MRASVKMRSKLGQSGGVARGPLWARGAPGPRLALHLGQALPNLRPRIRLQTVHCPNPCSAIQSAGTSPRVGLAAVGHGDVPVGARVVGGGALAALRTSPRQGAAGSRQRVGAAARAADSGGSPSPERFPRVSAPPKGAGIPPGYADRPAKPPPPAPSAVQSAVATQTAKGQPPPDPLAFGLSAAGALAASVGPERQPMVKRALAPKGAGGVAPPGGKGGVPGGIAPAAPHAVPTAAYLRGLANDRWIQCPMCSCPLYKSDAADVEDKLAL